MKFEDIKIGDEEFRLQYKEDGSLNMVLNKCFNGKYSEIYKSVKEFINLGWGYILVKDSGVSFGDTSCKAIAQKIKGCSRFYENGKVGCRNNLDEIVLPAIFDQIEFLSGGKFYIRGGDRYYLIYPDGGSQSGPWNYHNSKFYENDKVGWRGDGEVIIPARYNDVNKIWGTDIYEVREDNGYRYLNGQAKEILTQKKESYGIDEKAPYPESIYFMRSNKSDRICLFHFCDADSEDDEIFLTDHGRHASFMSLKHDEIMDIMSEGCTDLVIDEKALELFNNDFSYEFSGYLAFSDKENPLMDCMKQFKELGAHDNSWHYIIKIMTAKGEVIDPVELMQFRHYLENNPDMRPLSYTIGVGESESLEPGEVNVIMLTHYHERCWPATYEMNWTEYCNTESLDDLKEIEKDLKKEIYSSVKKEYKEQVLADQYKTPFWNIRYSGRNWKETEKVLNYLSDKFPGFKTFTHSFIGYLESSFFEDKFTPLEQMRFSANVLKWAAKKGCEFNLIREGQTVLDMLYACTKKDNYGQERTMVINELIPYLIKMGAKTLEQLRAEDEKDAPDYNREIGKIHRLCRISYP